VAVSGGVLLAATPAGLEVHPLPAATATSASAAGTVTLGEQAWGLAPYRRGVLAAAASAGLKRIDLSSPAAPAPAALFSGANVRQVEHWFRDVYYLDNGKIMKASETAGTASAPTFTTPAQLAQLGSAVSRFALAPGRIWTTVAGAVQSTRLPVAVTPASLTLGGAISDLAADEARAIAALGSSGFAVVGLDPTGSVVSLGTSTSFAADVVALEGSLAVTGSGTRLVAYDLSAMPPAPLGAVTTAGAIQRIRLMGRLAIVSELGAVELWDLSAPAHPVLVAALPAASPRDAVLSGDQIAIADGASLVSWPVPLAVTLPTARIYAPGPGTEVEPNQILDIWGVASGVGLDDVELLVNGRPYARLDEARPHLAFRIPPRSVPGEVLTLRLRARSLGGREAVSAPVAVRIVPTSTAAATLTLSSPSAGTYRSGQIVSAQACRAGAGVAPFNASARYILAPVAGAPSEEVPLGVLPADLVTPTCYAASVRLPVVDTQTAGTFAIDLVDGSGRVVTATRSVTLLAGATAPTTPTGLPAKLRAGPTVNTISLSATSPGTLWLDEAGSAGSLAAE
jgi:hypothetical protein